MIFQAYWPIAFTKSDDEHKNGKQIQLNRMKRGNKINERNLLIKTQGYKCSINDSFSYFLVYGNWYGHRGKQVM